MEKYDLTEAYGVVNYMREATSKNDWNNRCDAVKKVNNGYPDFWYQCCIASGLMDEVLGKGSSDIKIKLVTFPQEKIRRGKFLQEMAGDFNED